MPPSSGSSGRCSRCGASMTTSATKSSAASRRASAPTGSTSPSARSASPPRHTATSRPAGCPPRRPRRGDRARLLGLDPLLGQFPLEDLARRRARQLVDEVDLARHLVAGQVGLHVVLELLLADLLALALDDDRLQALAELLVVDAEHGHVGDTLVAGEQVLDLGREDVLAARDDHVVVAAVDVQAPAAVEMAHVAGGHEAVDDLL